VQPPGLPIGVDRGEGTFGDPRHRRRPPVVGRRGRELLEAEDQPGIPPATSMMIGRAGEAWQTILNRSRLPVGRCRRRRGLCGPVRSGAHATWPCDSSRTKTNAQQWAPFQVCAICAG
jgi:hypothetical protein